MIETALAIVSTPLAVISISRAENFRTKAIRPLLAGVLVFALVWGAVGTAVLGVENWRSILEAQIVVVCAIVAIASISRWAAAGFSDVLDAAASSLLVAILCGSGVFVAGGLIADVSPAALNIALLASPVVAAATAANVDLFRSAFLYEHSPVGHRLFTYPSWYEASAAYLTTAAVVLLISRVALRQAQGAPEDA